MPSRLTTELVRRGVLDASAVDTIMRSPALRGRLFALRLHLSGVVAEELVFSTLLELGARDATAQLAILPPARVLALVPSRLAEDCCLVPFLRSGNRLHVAMLDPSDDRAIEDLALFTSLAVEPYVARPRALFGTLFDAYRVPPPTPMAGFTLEHALETAVLPPPRDVHLPAVGIRTASSGGIPVHRDLVWEEPPHSDPGSGVFGDGSKSPLLASLASVQLSDAEFDDELTPAPFALQQDPPLMPTLPGKPVAAARVPGWHSPATTRDPVEGWQGVVNKDEVRRARDSVSAQLLPSLTSRFAHVAVFLVRHDLAVGWDGGGPHLDSQRIRDVLLPLTPPSTLRLAYTTRQVVAGDPERMDAIDRILLGFLGAPAPRQWLVLPVLGPGGVDALLYVDSEQTAIDAERRAFADAAASTLSDSLDALRQRYGEIH
ncbi:MAG: hypothetical protein ABIJ09_13985 [Pseudomonadota bacterium]